MAIEIPTTTIENDSYLSPVCDDSTIYVVSYNDTGSSFTNIRAIGFDGQIKWVLPLSSMKLTSAPVLSSNGTIYTANWEDTVFAINRNGTVKWTMKVLQNRVTSQMNLDKEGNLYFFAWDGVLYKVSPAGEVKWTLKLSNFGSSGTVVVFAPDGKTMYITADKLYAVSTDGQLKWAYQDPYDPNTWTTIPLVDASGNIYLYDGCVRIKSDGTLLPLLELPDSVKQHPVNAYIDPTIDKNGNLYIGLYGLTSFDYEGKFRWSINTRLHGFFSLVSDKDNNIYYLTEDSKLICVDDTGAEKWQLQLDGRYFYSPILTNGRMFFGTVHGTKRYFYSIK